MARFDILGANGRWWVVSRDLSHPEGGKGYRGPILGVPGERLRRGPGRANGAHRLFRASLPIVSGGVGLILLALYLYAVTCQPRNAVSCPPGTPCTTPALYCVHAWTPLALAGLVAGAAMVVGGHGPCIAGAGRRDPAVDRALRGPVIGAARGFV